MYTKRVGKYIRITKALARKMYDQGYPIYTIPCKKQFEWHSVFVTEISKYIAQDYRTNFDELVEETSCELCCNQYGKYLEFYVYDDDIILYKRSNTKGEK